MKFRGAGGEGELSALRNSIELSYFLIWNNSKYEPIAISHSYFYIIREYFTSSTSNRASHVIHWHYHPVYLGITRFVHTRAFPALSLTGAFYVQICRSSQFLIPHCMKYVAMLHKLLQEQTNISCEKKKLWTNALPFSVFLNVFGSFGHAKRIRCRSCRGLTVWKPQGLTRATQEVAGCRPTVHHQLCGRIGRYLLELGAKPR